MVKKTVKDKKMQENEASGDKQIDRVPEEEEDEISVLDGEEDEKKKSNGNEKCIEEQNISIKEEDAEGERVLEQIGQHNYSKLFLKRGSGPEEREEKTSLKMENAVVLDLGVNFNEGVVKRNETEEAEVLERKEEEIKGQGLPHDRKSRRQRIRSTYKVKLFKVIFSTLFM